LITTVSLSVELGGAWDGILPLQMQIRVVGLLMWITPGGTRVPSKNILPMLQLAAR